jgi:hypothetical protein
VEVEEVLSSLKQGGKEVKKLEEVVKNISNFLED